MTLEGKVRAGPAVALALALLFLLTAGCDDLLTPTTPAPFPTSTPDLAPTATVTPAPAPTPTPTATGYVTPTATPGPLPTAAPLTSPIPRPTASPVPEPTATPPTPVPEPTATPPTPIPEPTATPPTPVPEPTVPPTPTPIPTPAPTPQEEAEAALAQLLPWYDDPPYPLAVLPIIEMWGKDAELGRKLTNAPWLQDGLGPLESDAVYGLQYLYDEDPALARRMFAHSVEKPARTINVHALGALGFMALQMPAAFERLEAQEWFADGLSLEERAFIVVLAKMVGDDAIYTDLLEEWSTETRTVDLPLSGSVGVWAFGHEPITGDILTAAADGALAAERVMASPFPVTDIIMLQVNAQSYGGGWYGGSNFVDSMVLSTDSDWPDTAHAGLIYHEVSHYHLAFEIGPHWLVEGGADFIRDYRKAWDGSEDWEGEVPLFEGNEYAGRVWCVNNGVATIADLAEPSEFQASCGYALGQYFLTHLYDIMGLAGFSSAMREFYERYLDFQHHPTEEQVYRIFLKHTTPDQVAAFQDVYRRLHGGTFVDEE